MDAMERMDDVVDMYSPSTFEDLRKVEKMGVGMSIGKVVREIGQ